MGLYVPDGVAADEVLSGAPGASQQCRVSRAEALTPGTTVIEGFKRQGVSTGKWADKPAELQRAFRTVGEGAIYHYEYSPADKGLTLAFNGEILTPITGPEFAKAGRGSGSRRTNPERRSARRAVGPLRLRTHFSSKGGSSHQGKKGGMSFETFIG